VVSSLNSAVKTDLHCQGHNTDTSPSEYRRILESEMCVCVKHLKLSHSALQFPFRMRIASKEVRRQKVKSSRVLC
jgi:hypothetical protein